MPNRLLVVHGPNVPLRLERGSGPSLSALHRALNAVARDAGVTLRFAHVHGEEGLLGELWTQRKSIQGLLWVPGPHGSTPAIEEALALLDFPVERLAGSSPSRADYEAGLRGLIERVAAGKRVPIGRKVAGATRSPGSTKSIGGRRGEGPKAGGAAAPKSGVKKTLGRRRASAADPERSGPPRVLGRAAGSRTGGELEASHPTQPPRGRQGGVPSRAQTRERIAQRLSGAMTASGLSAWAQEGWTRAEAQQAPDTKLSAVLLSLMAGQRLSEDRLVSLMAELDS